MPIKAIVFDMDDTLVKEEEYAFSGFRVLDLWVQAEYGIAGFAQIARRMFRNGDRKNIINKALDELRIRYDQAQIQRYVSIFRGHKPDIHLLPDAEWVLQQLQGTVRLGLISDGYLVSQANKVKVLGLHNRLDAIVLTDELGKEHWKPSPVPYERICTELGVAHQECVYIGDNASKDFIAANRLGWTTVHISRKGGVYQDIKATPEYRAQYKIGNLKELAAIPKLKHLFAVTKRYATQSRAVDL